MGSSGSAGFVTLFAEGSRSPARTLVPVLLLLGFAAVSLAACAGPGQEEGADSDSAGTDSAAEGTADMASPSQEPVTLGPADGLDLPATDLERVAVGTLAPDFTLETITGEYLTLSSFRGAQNVVLVFYRGHW